MKIYKLTACLAALAMTALVAQARPTVSGTTKGGHTSTGAARGYQGTASGTRGTATGAGGHVVVPGTGGARAGTYQATGANGGTFQSQGVNAVTKQGGLHQNSANWNGKNSTGSATSSGAWKAGQGGQGSTSVEGTNKNTGQTYSAEGDTQYNKETGGSTTVTTGNGTTKTKTYPANP